MENKSNTVRKSPKKGKSSKNAMEYVIPLGGTGWVVKNSLAKQFTAISDSKSEAIKIARSLAKQYGTELVVFAKDGSIQQQVSYAI